MLQTRATLVSPIFSGHEEEIGRSGFPSSSTRYTKDRYKIKEKLNPVDIPHAASLRKLNIG